MRQRFLQAWKHVLAVAAVAVAATSCGDVVRTGNSPMMLVVDQIQAAPGGGHGAGQFTGFLLSDVLVLVTSGGSCTVQAPCPTTYDDSGQVILALAAKNTGITPTSNNQVTVNRIHIAYVRADGHNVEGVDVPYAFDAASTVTVPPAGTATMSFELVRHAAKDEPPLLALIDNGQIINTIAQVTFYGTDQVGNAINVTANIQVNFGNFGDQ